MSHRAPVAPLSPRVGEVQTAADIERSFQDVERLLQETSRLALHAKDPLAAALEAQRDLQESLRRMMQANVASAIAAMRSSVPDWVGVLPNPKPSDLATSMDQWLGVSNENAEKALASLSRQFSNREFLDRALEVSDTVLDEASVGDAVPAAATAGLLGGPSVLGQMIHEPIDMARAVQAGLPSAVLDGLRQAGFNGPEIEDVVAPSRTLARRRKEGRLSIEESAAVERLARTLVTAERVLGSRQAALGWLRRPLKTRLGGLAPIEYLQSDIGARVVEEILVQAEYGLTA